MSNESSDSMSISETLPGADVFIFSVVYNGVRSSSFAV